METRANYILIGAFTLAGFAGILAFFLWFANIQLDRQFAYYDIDFPTITGLSEASDVRFSGLPVGQVVDVRLSPEDDGRVRVRVEIDAETPVRTDSRATIEAQGVTGVSYVSISSGTSDAPLLSTVVSEGIPKIEAGQSVLQSLSEDAPEILSEMLAAVQELRSLISDANQTRVENILENIEVSSASFAKALDDFSSVSRTISDFARQIDRFNTSLDTITKDASVALSDVQATVSSIKALSEETRLLVAQGTGTLTSAEATIGTANRYVNEELGPATQQLDRSVAAIETRFAALSDSLDNLVTTFSETGKTATLRLTEAKDTLAATNALIARIEATLSTVDGAARRIDTLIVDNGTPLLEDLRVATSEATTVIRRIGEVAENDLPTILGEIRTATETASDAVATVGDDLSLASGRLDDITLNAGEALDSARDTFAKANETLSAINAALETGDRALKAVETTFQGADRIMNEDVAEIVDSLRSTMTQLESAVGKIAEQIPGVADELRAASRSAELVFGQVETAVAQSSPAFRDFATTTLPQFSRLATESRSLIGNLDALVEQIRRDPSRFFVAPRAPEFRR